MAVTLFRSQVVVWCSSMIHITRTAATRVTNEPD
jgi:hypothetical protein